MPYTRTQILLHWAVVALVVVQLATSDAMEEAQEAVERAEAVGRGEALQSWVHIVSGLTILVLVLWRLGLRARFGAPPLPPDLSPLFRFGARAVHFALYALLIGLPVTGALTVWVEPDFGGGHGVLKNLLLVLIVLHVSAALFHGIVRRDGVFSRMVRPAGARGGLPPG
jgi:cytochrome b561